MTQELHQRGDLARRGPAARFGDMRTRETIERELRLLATVRNAYREHGYVLPSIGPVDALLDELSELLPAP